ncbi:MAG: F-box/LRR-repeat protein 13 [Chlamydiia bacterium]|nr:F-box/LRR-repeat protein 13 [Chlamydiia bacterium]
MVPFDFARYQYSVNRETGDIFSVTPEDVEGRMPDAVKNATRTIYELASLCINSANESYLSPEKITEIISLADICIEVVAESIPALAKATLRKLLDKKNIAELHKAYAQVQHLSSQEIAQNILKREKNEVTQAINMLVKAHRRLKISGNSVTELEIFKIVEQLLTDITVEKRQLSQTFDVIPKDFKLEVARFLERDGDNDDITAFLEAYPEVTESLFSGQDAFVNRILRNAFSKLHRLGSIPDLLKKALVESGKTIQKLDFSRVQGISGMDIQELVRLFPCLSKLILCNCNIGNEILVEVAKLSQLQVLDISHNPRIDDNGLKSILPLAQLACLVLSGKSRITDEGVDHLAKLKNLEKLNLQNCAITPEGLKKLSDLKLTELNIWGALGVTDATIKQILDNQPHLEKFIFAFSRGVTQQTMRSMEYHPTLIECIFGLPRMHQIAWYPKAREIKTVFIDPLFLQPNEEEFTLLLATLPPYAIRMFFSRDEIDSVDLNNYLLSHSVYVASFFDESDALVEKVLRTELEGSNNFTGIPQLVMESLIAAGRTIHKLDLHKCKINIQTMKRIVEMFPHLRDLNLSSCDINDAALAEVAKLTKLEKLALAKNPELTDKGFTDFATATCKDTTPLKLIELDLSGCSLSDLALKSLRELSTLKKLNLSYMTNITSNGLNELTSLRLHELNMIVCSNLAKDSVKMIADQQPDLNTLRFTLDQVTKEDMECLSAHLGLQKCEIRGKHGDSGFNWYPKLHQIITQISYIDEFFGNFGIDQISRVLRILPYIERQDFIEKMKRSTTLLTRFMRESIGFIDSKEAIPDFISNLANTFKAVKFLHIPSLQELRIILQTFPCLEEFNLQGLRSTDDVIRFLSQSRFSSLKKITLTQATFPNGIQSIPKEIQHDLQHIEFVFECERG